MATSVPARLILLTGPPGVGKTTLVQKACTALKETNTPVQGFYTEEVRSGVRRIGFDVVTLCGNRGPLARVDSSDGSGPQQREHKVGQYSVKLNAFEQTALPVLRIPASSNTAPPVIVVDEIGKMEMFSTTFVQMVRSLVSRGNTTVLATIPVPKGRPLPLVEELRSHKDAHVFEISKSNRDSLLQDIVSAVQLSRKTYSCQK